MNNINLIEEVLCIIDPQFSNCIHVKEWINRKDLFNLIVKFAEKNGLYYYFIHRLKDLDIALPYLDNKRWNEENQKISKFKATLLFLNRLSREYAIDYILIKIFDTVLHTPNDIDIFIRMEDRQKLIELLKTQGMVLIYSSPAETKLKGQYMEIDIYTTINYFGVDYIDADFLWNSKIKKKFFGLEYPALNDNADFLMLIPHYIFGHGRITLLDFLHLKNRMEYINIDTCRNYAYENGWGYLFNSMMNLLIYLRKVIYEDKQINPHLFPYIFDRNFVVRCLSGIKGFNLGWKEKIFLYISLNMNYVIYKYEGTFIYNIFKSFTPAKELINSLSSFIKTKRGDKKSLNKKV
jgi:hypothetical protein